MHVAQGEVGSFLCKNLVVRDGTYKTRLKEVLKIYQDVETAEQQNEGKQGTVFA